MPELPEVETVRRGLEKLVIGKEVKSVTVLWDNIVQAPGGVADFVHRMPGQSLLSVERIGKFLIFNWTDVAWIAHLRMEGKYLYVPTTESVDAYSHVILHLTDGYDLRYRDVRKFGRIHMVDKNQLEQAINALNLGPEPKDLTTVYLKGKLEKRKRPIKGVLLDQSVIAGIGNIYADEVLYAAKVHPEQAANTLTDPEIQAIVDASQAIIGHAVEVGGTTIRSYTNAFGENGHYQQYLQAYGRTGKPCARCGTPIEKISVSQRGSHFCPNCQKVHG
ncbi:DNA-formamidopyrimidine glycosylase [Aerococcus agrisoli]|uniref:Formamidopyrimidine-DNA glycosylase n=1 Tax=Aerococcus agrisoli TaxID=2487350 RepID=A0A3N4G4B5_9LACT|nr:DNA-formamidopyrimidine glycosylase [Aerococcus agrisoli]RPA57225.1 DNA-formamidopyrimidine glycosylase [Aerococcus agrisoli]